MAVRAATDGYNRAPPGGDEGSGSGIDAATAVLDGRGSVLAWSAGDVTGRPAAMLLASDLPASARRCMAEQRGWNGRVSLRHMDGGRVDLELLAHPSRGSDGSLRWILVTFTECQPFAGADRVQPDAPFVDWAFTQSPFALAIHDGDLLCLRVNDRMCQMFGLTEDELCGRRLAEVLPGPQYEAMERYMRHVLDTGESAHRETYRRVPGETRERAWSVSVSPLKDQVGRTQAVWIGALDIIEQYWAMIRKFGIHSVLSVPIRARGVTLGAAVFLRGRRPEPFQRDDVLLAEELTARAALSLDNARRYTRERTTALALQRSLLPQRLPRQSAVEVASRYLPASAQLGVGGDWFDVIPLSGARVALVVGDVVGHGLHASATMGRRGRVGDQRLLMCIIRGRRADRVSGSYGGQVVLAGRIWMVR